MIWRRQPRGFKSNDISPEQVFERVRVVESELRGALALFRKHLNELEAEITASQEEV